MRDTLLRHPWRLVAAASLLVAAVAIGPIAVLSGLASGRRRHPPAQSRRPRPPASAPEPTLVSAQATAQATAGHRRGHPRERARALAVRGHRRARRRSRPRAPAPSTTPSPRAKCCGRSPSSTTCDPRPCCGPTTFDDPDLLLVGQHLLIPPTDGVLYTVRPGDRLADVANRYGVDLQAIVSANQLDDADQIQAGVDIFLPGGRPLSPRPVTADAAQARRRRAGSGGHRSARRRCPTTSTRCSALAG